jgi:hypothetical protein
MKSHTPNFALQICSHSASATMRDANGRAYYSRTTTFTSHAQQEVDRQQRRCTTEEQHDREGIKSNMMRIGFIILATLAFLPVGQGRIMDCSSTPCVPTFEVSLEDLEMEHMHRALSLIRETHPREFFNSTISHHFLCRQAPKELQDEIAKLGIWTRQSSMVRH